MLRAPQDPKETGGVEEMKEDEVYPVHLVLLVPLVCQVCLDHLDLNQTSNPSLIRFNNPKDQRRDLHPTRSHICRLRYTNIT